MKIIRLKPGFSMPAYAEASMIVTRETTGWDVTEYDTKVDVLWAIAKGVSDLDSALRTAKARARERGLTTIWVEESLDPKGRDGG